MNRDKGSGIVQVKTVLSEEGDAVVRFLPVQYDYFVTEDAVPNGGDLQCITLRCSLFSMDEVATWIQTYQKNSHTRWIVGRCLSGPTRFILRRQWYCHHSCHNKGKAQKSKSTNCTAKIDFKIKKLTPDTKKKDEFLRLMPPFPTIIKIYYHHNHTDEYVIKREQVLAEFAATQNEIKSELLRLQNLITRGKPGLSAMKQFLNQLKAIETETQLFESMRKVRLKPILFPRIGRPPKGKRLDDTNANLFLKKSELQSILRHRKKASKLANNSSSSIATREQVETSDADTTTATATLIALDPDAEYNSEDPTIEFHAIEEGEEDNTPTGSTIDISFLFNQ